MAEVTKQNYYVSPTMRFVDAEGRLTQQGFDLIKAAAELVSAVTIVDGEVTTAKLADLAVQASKLDNGAVVVGKLAAGSISVSTLFVDEVIITSKVAQNAISELSALIQSGSAGPNGDTILSGTVPVSGSNNSGLLLTFTGFMDLPTSSSGNFGYWRLRLQRNGSVIDSTPYLYYDDNFSYQPVATFIDETPGSDPDYTVVTELQSGPGSFSITGSVLNIGLLKR